MDQIVVKDQVGARNDQSKLVMDWQTGMSCTARQLILERVRVEVERSSADRARLSAASRCLVDLPVPARSSHDDATQLAVLAKAQQLALAGFVSNAFVLLVDDEQITGLDHEFSIDPETDVTFVRLLPLKGG